MRQILISYAKRRNTLKRGGSDTEIIPIDLEELGTQPEEVLTALNTAIAELKRVNSSAAGVIELHYFCGFTIEKMAELLNLSTATVKRRQQTAQAWLKAFISEQS